MRQVVIYPGEDGYWVAECPSLPGCISQGTTREEAIANIRSAIRLYIARWKRTICRFPKNASRPWWSLYEPSAEDFRS